MSQLKGRETIQRESMQLYRVEESIVKEEKGPLEKIDV